MLLENASLIFWQHGMLSCQSLGIFWQGKRLLENWPPPSGTGTLLDVLLRDCHSLLELFWIVLRPSALC